MTHSDELEMRYWVLDRGMTPRQAGEMLGVPNKRVEYYCRKWSKRGEYDWGVCIDIGWSTKRTDDE